MLPHVRQKKKNKKQKKKTKKKKKRKKKKKKKEESNYERAEKKDISILNKNKILLRTHQCFCTSITWENEVYDDLPTLKNKGSTWPRLFSNTYHSI